MIQEQSLKQLTKPELLDWIDFQYLHLLDCNVFIGGYFFNFSHLKEFEKIRKNLSKYVQNINSGLLNIKLNVKNRYNEDVSFPCTEEEFEIIYQTLKNKKEDVDNFKSFLINELKEANKKNLNSFMVYVNDATQQIKQELLTGEQKK